MTHSVQAELVEAPIFNLNPFGLSLSKPNRPSTSSGLTEYMHFVEAVATVEG